MLNWNMREIRKIDRIIRKLVGCKKMNNPKVDVDIAYLPKAQGV